MTTPQEISLADVRKSIHFCHQVNMKILGLVENMSGLVCPHCGKVIDLFKTGGGMITAKRENVTLLGSLPLEPTVVQNGDAGNMALLDNQELPFSRAFQEMVDKIIETHKDKVAFPIRKRLKKLKRLSSFHLRTANCLHTSGTANNLLLLGPRRAK